MLAAAGIVVTEISTPASAPDFDVVSDRIPATPAQNATKNVKKSGFAKITEKLWSASVNSSGVRSVHLKISEARYAAPIATGKPASSATSERTASCGRPCDDRDAEARERTELRAQHHRADDQDRGVQEDPDRRDERRERP